MKQQQQQQHGFGLLEVLAVIAISSLLLLSYARMSSDSGKQLKGTATAQNFKQVYDAGTRYIKDNYGLLLASTPTVITTSMLVSAGYLTPTYSGLNPFAQSTSINITQPVANNLQAVVITSNGNAIPEAMAPVIVSKIGSSSAYFPVLTPNIAKGAFGGWSLDLTGTSTGAGHLAGLLFYNNGDLVSDYLQRHQTPGHPEVNEMFTDINMGGGQNNNINNAGNINATNLNASNNATIGGTVSADNQSTTNNNVSNTFQVTGVSNAGTACSPNGLIAQNGSGALLSCVNGVWRTNGITQTVIRAGGVSATCLSSETFVSGMCIGYDYCGGNDSSAYGSVPIANGIACQQINCTGTTAYALCAQ